MPEFCKFVKAEHFYACDEGKKELQPFMQGVPTRRVPSKSEARLTTAIN
jgi:hypothetical protein